MSSFPGPPGQAQAQPGLILTPGEEHLRAQLQRPGKAAEEELVCDLGARTCYVLQGVTASRVCMICGSIELEV